MNRSTKSELLNEVLFRDVDLFDEVLRWLQHSEISVLWKNSDINKFEFAEHLLRSVNQYTCRFINVTQNPRTDKNINDLEKQEEVNPAFSSPLNTGRQRKQRVVHENSDKGTMSKPRNARAPTQLILGDFLVTTSKFKKNKTRSKRNEQQKEETVPVIKKQKVRTPPKHKFLRVHKIIIDKLAKLISTVISSNLIVDILSVLHHLLVLLVSDPDKKFPLETHMHGCNNVPSTKTEYFIETESCLFKSGFEAVYFAAMVLQEQWNVLLCLGKSILNGILHIPLTSHVSEFVETIRSHLQSWKNTNINTLDRETLANTVTFQMATDARTNFKSESEFHLAKKQRDGFYAILSDWKIFCMNRSSSEFFKINFAKVRCLFEIELDDEKFAELFASQILSSVFNEDEVSFLYCDLMELAIQVECEKMYLQGIPIGFSSSNRRFVTPCSIVSGLEKRYPGVQTFFSHFLRICNETTFLGRLWFVLIEKIDQLNNFKITCDVNVALEKEGLFLSCINKLCLLAKYLSLVSFLLNQHYSPDYDMGDGIYVNIEKYLKDAMLTGRLVVTVPWVVEFLKGVDTDTQLFSHYRSSFSILQFILCAIKLPNKDKADIMLMFSKKNIQTNFGVRMSTVKRFRIGVTQKYVIPMSELEDVAKEGKDEFVERYVKELFFTIQCSQLLITFYINSFFSNIPETNRVIPININGMRAVQMYMNPKFYVGEMSLYECCPELHQLVNMIKRKARSSLDTKSHTDVLLTNDITKGFNSLMQETYFFENMPKKIKPTVDCVSDSLSTKYVTLLRSDTLKMLKQDVKKHLECLEYSQEMDVMFVDRIVQRFYYNLRNDVECILTSLRQDVKSVLSVLIKFEETNETVIGVCAGIAYRKCSDILMNWIINYIEPYDIIYNEINGFEKKLSKRINELNGSVVENGEEDERNREKKSAAMTCTAYAILESFQRCILVVMNSKDSRVSVNTILSLLSGSVSYLNDQSDEDKIAVERILLSSLYLCVVLIIYQPEMLSQELLNKFNEVWKYKEISNKLTFETIISNHSLQLYCDQLGKDFVTIRKAFTMVLEFMISNKLMSESELLSQICSIYGRPWPKILLVQLVQCLDDVQSNCSEYRNELMCEIRFISSFFKVEQDILHLPCAVSATDDCRSPHRTDS